MARQTISSRRIIKPSITTLIKWKRGQPIEFTTTKWAKMSWTFFLLDLSWFSSWKYIICRWRGFSPITLHRCFCFLFQYPIKLGDFSLINLILILYCLYCIYRIRSMILRNLIYFFIFLFIGKRFFYSFHKSNIKQ